MNNVEKELQELSKLLEKQAEQYEELLEKHRQLETDYRSDRKLVITGAGIVTTMLLALWGITSFIQVPTKAQEAVLAQVPVEVAAQVPIAVSTQVIKELDKQVPTVVASQIPKHIATEVAVQVPTVVAKAVGSEVVNLVLTTTNQITQNAIKAQASLDTINTLVSQASEAISNTNDFGSRLIALEKVCLLSYSLPIEAGGVSESFRVPGGFTGHVYMQLGGNQQIVFAVSSDGNSYFVEGGGTKIDILRHEVPGEVEIKYINDNHRWRVEALPGKITGPINVVLVGVALGQCYTH